MPKSIVTARQFVSLAQRPDAQWVKITRVGIDTAKLKLRTAKILYTLTVRQAQMIQNVIDALPEGLEKKFDDSKRVKKEIRKEIEENGDPDEIFPNNKS